jgi:hypothetical protein
MPGIVGEFILLMARDAAARQGVEAKSVIRHGNVGEEIIQGQPVRGANVTLRSEPGGELFAEDVTQPDCRYALILPGTFPDDPAVRIERPHFAEARAVLGVGVVEALRSGTPVVLPDTTLLRRVTRAFWVSTPAFVAVLVLIASGRLHNTLPALLGASLLFAMSYPGHDDLDPGPRLLVEMLAVQRGCPPHRHKALCRKATKEPKLKRW